MTDVKNEPHIKLNYDSIRRNNYIYIYASDNGNNNLGIKLSHTVETVDGQDHHDCRILPCASNSINSDDVGEGELEGYDVSLGSNDIPFSKVYSNEVCCDKIESVDINASYVKTTASIITPSLFIPKGEYERITDGICFISNLTKIDIDASLSSRENGVFLHTYFKTDTEKDKYIFAAYDNNDPVLYVCRRKSDSPYSFYSYYSRIAGDLGASSLTLRTSIYDANAGSIKANKLYINSISDYYAESEKGGNNIEICSGLIPRDGLSYDLGSENSPFRDVYCANITVNDGASKEKTVYSSTISPTSLKYYYSGSKKWEIGIKKESTALAELFDLYVRSGNDLYINCTPAQIEVYQPTIFKKDVTFNEKIYGKDNVRRYITCPPKSTTTTTASNFYQRDLPIGGISGVMIPKSLLYPYSGSSPDVLAIKYNHAGESISVNTEELTYAEFSSSGVISRERVNACFLPKGTYTLLTSAKFDSTTSATHDSCYVFALVMRTT